MKNQPHHQECPFCQWVQVKPEYAIEENENFLSLANISPDVEGHILIITKEPITNITQLTKKEWNNLLPILKSVTNKLTNIFQPIGFNIYSNSGSEGAARQAVFHFHLHVIPEREGNRGVGYLRKPWFIPSVEKFAEINETLQTNNKGILQENDTVVAQLIEREQASDYGHIVISSKNSKNNDLNKIDSETWSQMGELLRESITKVEQNLNHSSLRIILFLGKIGGMEKQDNKLQIHLIPRYQSRGYTAKEVIPIPPEVLELAEKLKQIEKKTVVQEEEIITQIEESYDPSYSKNKDDMELDVKSLSNQKKRNLSISQEELFKQNKKNKKDWGERLESRNINLSKDSDLLGKSITAQEDWQDLNKNFTKELQQKWARRNFDYQQTKKWINIGLTPTEVGLAFWITEKKDKNIKNSTDVRWMENNLKELRLEHKQFLERRNNNWKEHGQPFLDFTEELTREWIDQRFTKPQCQEWLNIGMKSSDSSFCSWLRDEIKLDALEILNNMNSENNYQEEDLREQFRHHLLTKKEKTTWQLILKLRERNFGWKEIEKLVNYGVKLKEIDFICWLKNSKKFNLKEILEFVNDEQFRIDWLISKWHNEGFTNEEIGAWNNVGVELNDNYFASYLNKKGYQPQDDLDLKGLKKEYQRHLEIRSKKGTSKSSKASHANWINWQDETKEFKDFNEKLTREWIQEGFSKEETREWLKFGFIPKELPSFIYFLTDIKNLTVADFQEIKKEQYEGQKKEFSEWVKQFVWCDHCQKRIEREKTYFSDREKNLDFCSVSCQDRHKDYTQGWLDRWYPKNDICLRENEGKLINNFGKTRSEITKLNISDRGLTGSLDLTDFINLEELDCSNNKISKLILPSNKILKKLLCSNNLLSEIDLNHYSNLDELNINNNKLTNLDINQNTNLTKLRCDNNNLKEIDLRNNSKLEVIEVNDCYLTSFDYGSLNPNTLTSLNISDNNLPPTDISVFSPLVNLEALLIGNWCGQSTESERIQVNLYNHFYGSLESWKDLTKLESLEISNTDIDRGSECLPKSVKKMLCSTKEKSNCGLKRIEKDLQEKLKENNKIEWVNWKDESTLFWEFNKRITQRWINEGFTKEQAKEWLSIGVYRDYPFHAYFLINIERLTSEECQELKKDKEKIEEQLKKFCDWMSNFAQCGYCRKRFLESEICFTDSEIKFACCSSKCKEMINSAQKQIDKLYSKGGFCTKEGDENYGKTRSEITKLDLKDQDLAGYLDLSDFTNLEKLDCSENQVTYLDISKNIKLEKLDISNNIFFPSNLSWLSHLVNLKELNLNNNDFVGSFEFTKDMKKLESICIMETDLDGGLEYLPNSLKSIGCLDCDMHRAFGKRSKIEKRLNPYLDNLSLWKTVHPDLVSKTDNDLITFDYSNVEPIKTATVPNFLQKELSKNFAPTENYHPNLNYSDFLLRDGRPFAWENSENNLSSQLPTRLYNIAKGKNKQHISERKILNQDVELTQFKEGEPFVVNPNIQRYVGMSYVCGLLKNDGEIYANARKALNKVIKALELINKGKKEEDKINHVWIDQLSILQDGEEGRIDKEQEIPKMKDYYNNSLATLVAIDAEIGNEVDKTDEVELIKHILKKIVQSSWFQRSWCFQEGLLSKQAIFMFDDYLVDGRLLALFWGNLQSASETERYGLKEYLSGLMELNNDPKIFATPLGWSYGAKPKSSVNLSLGEALYSVKHRQQTVLVDSIYSILGLLPYRKEIEVEYKKKDCSCKECDHWPVYDKKDLEKILHQVGSLNFLRAKDFHQFFSWIGSLNKEYWYLPFVNEDCSFEIEGVTNNYVPSKGIKITSKGVGLEQTKILKVKEISDDNKFIKLYIEGTKFELELSKTKERLKIKKNDKLVIVSEARKELALLNYGLLNSYLAILVPASNDCSIQVMEIQSAGELEMDEKNIFVDLVEKSILKDGKNYSHTEVEEEQLTDLGQIKEQDQLKISVEIKMNNSEQELTDELQNQIEIFPKN